MQTANEQKTIVKSWINDKVSQVHTAMPGQIVSYSPGSNRASIQPTGSYKTNDGRNISYPIIHNVPLQFPMGCGGKSGVTFPISAGDGCMIIFAESQTDDYVAKGKGDSSDLRRHSLNDAMAIPGLYSGSAPSNVSNANDVSIVNGGSSMQLGAGGFSAALADGTSFSFSGGDLVVNGISLTKHVHGGVSSGGDKTEKPE